MKKLAPKLIGVIMLVLVVFIAFTGKINFFDTSKSEETLEKQVVVEKWDNYYEGDNIQLYYLKQNNDNINSFGKKHNLENLAKESEDELDKSIMLLKWLKNRVHIDLKAESISLDAFEINLYDQKQNNMSPYNFIELFREGAAYLGINSRTGVFYGKSSETGSALSQYFVCEIWNSKFDKWIAVDVINDYYFEKNNIPLSALEILNNQPLKEVKLINYANTYDEKVKDNINKQFDNNMSSYSININNNKYGELDINSKIMYVRENKNPELELDGGFLAPTIFVKDDEVFNLSPLSEEKDRKKDDKITLILSKAKNEEKEDQNKTEFVGGIFKDSGMIDDYYYSINGSDWKYMEEEYFFKIKLEKERNIIKISQDGKNPIREIILSNKIESTIDE